MSRLSLLVLLTTVVGCSDYDIKSSTEPPPEDPPDEPIVEPDDPVLPEAMTDTYSVSSEELGADIIFFGDTSGSMSEELSVMGDNVSRFVDRLAQNAGNWRLMAVTTADGCAAHMLQPSTPNYATKFANDITRAPPPLQSFRTEQGLFVARAALRATEPGGCNQGFLRPDAQLHVIFISDERDQSPNYNQNNYWINYLNEMVSYKGSRDMAKFSAVAGPVPGGCTGTNANADEGLGYSDVVTASNGEFLSICDDWAAQLDVLADASVRQHRFTLSENADPDTIVVYVNDIDREGDWEYVASASQVRFIRDAPEGGDDVRIEYDTLP